jgi:hypothetical protein
MVSQQRTSALSTTFENPPAMEIWNPNRMVYSPQDTTSYYFFTKKGSSNLKVELLDRDVSLRYWGQKGTDLIFLIIRLSFGNGWKIERASPAVLANDASHINRETKIDLSPFAVHSSGGQS